MYEIKKHKTEIRETYRALRNNIPKQTRELFDQAICNSFTNLISYRYAHVILAYAPKEDEVNITPIIQDALSKGKKVALPRCSAETGEMSYRLITSLDQLHIGTFGILEPDESLPLYAQNDKELSLCIVPAIVYDKDGYRIGYGRGYYDRYLSGSAHTLAGVAYEDFVIAEKLPRGRFDLAVNIIVTEKKIIHCHS